MLVLIRSPGISATATTWRISRYLTRAGLVTPQPKKRPRSSYLRFVAEQPNECWQSDFIHWSLADGSPVEIISWIDDHSRLALHISAYRTITGLVVLATFRTAVARHGPPAATLTDNGLVYTTRFAGGRGGRNHLESELRRLGVTQKNGRPSHPQTQGKVERFQHTLQKWLIAQPPADSLNILNDQLDRFADTYNHHRPHRSLPQRATPATIYNARPKAVPGNRSHDTHHRVRTDTIDNTGTVTLRHAGRLHHIGIGRAHARTHVLLLVEDLHVRVIDAATGELLRDLTLNPNQDYQPTGRPPGPPPHKTNNPEPR